MSISSTILNVLFYSIVSLYLKLQNVLSHSLTVIHLVNIHSILVKKAQEIIWEIWGSEIQGFSWSPAIFVTELDREDAEAPSHSLVSFLRSWKNSPAVEI